jgi:hypothetical protein
VRPVAGRHWPGIVKPYRLPDGLPCAVAAHTAGPQSVLVVVLVVIIVIAVLVIIIVAPVVGCHDIGDS